MTDDVGWCMEEYVGGERTRCHTHTHKHTRKAGISSLLKLDCNLDCHVVNKIRSQQAAWRRSANLNEPRLNSMLAAKVQGLVGTYAPIWQKCGQ